MSIYLWRYEIQFGHLEFIFKGSNTKAMNLLPFATDVHRACGSLERYEIQFGHIAFIFKGSNIKAKKSYYPLLLMPIYLSMDLSGHISTATLRFRDRCHLNK